MEKVSQETQPISLLCVDDDVAILELLRKYFELENDFSIFTCSTAKEALDLVHQYQFDAIIADYTMPDMDGITLLKEIRAQNDSAIFIMFTGRHLAQVAIDTLNNGGNYYVQKGIDIQYEMPRVVKFIRNSIKHRHQVQPVPDIEMRYRSLVEHQPDILCCLLPDGTCTLANAALARFLGKSENTLPGSNFFSFIPVAEREEIKKIVQSLNPQKPDIYLEHHLLNRQGVASLYQWGYRALFDDHGVFREYLCLGRDISALVHLQDILPGYAPVQEPGSAQTAASPPPPATTATSALANLADSIEMVQYPIFAIDRQGKVIAWNHAIAELTGVDAKSIIGQGDYAYAFPMYGEPRPMLIDYILKSPTGQSASLMPGITRDGDTYSGQMETVTIRGRSMQVWGKGTPIYDGKGTVIAAVQSLLVSEQGGEGISALLEDGERYIGGVSSIILKVAGDGMSGAIAGAIGSTTGGYGVYATDQRLFVVHNPELDASQDKGVQFGEFIIDELFGTNVDTRPRSIGELENLKVFEVWRKDIASIDMKKPRLLAGFLIIRTKAGGSFRIFVDHKKAFTHLEQLLRLFYPEIIKEITEEIDDSDLEWLDEIRTLELIGKLQLEDPLQEIPHTVTTHLPSLPAPASITVTRGQCREIEQSIDAVPYPIFAIDRQGKVIAWNKAIAELTGIEVSDMLGKGDYEYALPFYSERKPMLIDYLVMPPDAAVHGELPAITRDGDTLIGNLESVTIRGKPMLIWGKGTGIYNAKGSLIASIQSMLFSEQLGIKSITRKSEDEQYIGGLASITVKLPEYGVAGEIANALGSTNGGYGIYGTNQRLFVVHHPDLDTTHTKGLQFAEFIMDELFGTTVDTHPHTISELENLKVFEVWRNDIATIEMKKPLLFAGYITFKTRSGESFRIYTDHKKAFIHFDQLLRMFFSEILRIE